MARRKLNIDSLALTLVTDILVRWGSIDQRCARQEYSVQTKSYYRTVQFN